MQLKKGLPQGKPFFGISHLVLAVTSAVASGRVFRSVITVLAAVKAGIESVEVLAVKIILGDSQGFAETLEMYNFTLSQEADGSAHVRVINQSQDIVIGGSGLLFGGHVFKQVSDNVPRGLELVGGERNTARCLGPDAQGVIHIVFVKAASLDLLHGEVAGQLVDNGPYDLHVSQFLGAYIVLRNVPNQALYGQARCFRPICT